MSARGFTRGPWAVSKQKARRVTAGGVIICNSVLRNKGGPKHKTELKDEHEAEANANLIAAAPDLYEALTELFASYKQLADSGDAGNWYIEDQPEGKKALAALAKAEGRS